MADDFLDPAVLDEFDEELARLVKALSEPAGNCRQLARHLIEQFAGPWSRRTIFRSEWEETWRRDRTIPLFIWRDALVRTGLSDPQAQSLLAFIGVLVPYVVDTWVLDQEGAARKTALEYLITRGASGGTDIGLPRATKKGYSDPDNYDRNVWLYNERKASRSWTHIKKELNEERHDWAPLYTDNACRAAIVSIAEYHDWPKLAGTSGRPRKV